jgi:hypothetical protein
MKSPIGRHATVGGRLPIDALIVDCYVSAVSVKEASWVTVVLFWLSSEWRSQGWASAAKKAGNSIPWTAARI